MTNHQCYCYAVKAISNILNNKIWSLTPDSFYYEIFMLWDMYDEKSIEELVKKEDYKGMIDFCVK